MLASPSHTGIWLIGILVLAGVIFRPWRLPEATWAVLGSCVLVMSSLISLGDAWTGIKQGTDVYLFLIGMMLLAELARHEGLFDWLAAIAVRRSRGSPGRLFASIYGVGVIVTAFLSNDATAVVLTPAVYAAARSARAEPMPYLLICAFVANAASYVLPVSNPANLVVYAGRMPSLTVWLAEFGLASLFSIAVTFGVLRLSQRASLGGEIHLDAPMVSLPAGGLIAAGGIVLTAIVLLLASGFDRPLGLPTFLAGGAATIATLILNRRSSWPILKDVSWGVLPLVAGLFILVQAVKSTGVMKPLLEVVSGAASPSSALGLGAAVAFLSNAVNNLPVGVVAGSVAGSAHLSQIAMGSLLIGIDLGPNLSVTGSLATILWLTALRREGEEMSGWKFLGLGCLVMPPALLASLVAFIWLRVSS